MALIPCNECGKEYSSDAKACPHCGKRRTRRSTKLIGVLIVLFAIMAIIGSIKEDTAKDEVARKEAARRASLTLQQRAAEDAKKAQKERIFAARRVCDAAVRQSLYDPDSAKMEHMIDWYAEERKDGSILIQPAGRAKNAFGAYINGVWGCVAKNGALVSLKQIHP